MSAPPSDVDLSKSMWEQWYTKAQNALVSSKATVETQATILDRFAKQLEEQEKSNPLLVPIRTSAMSLNTALKNTVDLYVNLSSLLGALDFNWKRLAQVETNLNEKIANIKEKAIQGFLLTQKWFKDNEQVLADAREYFGQKHRENQRNGR